MKSKSDEARELIDSCMKEFGLFSPDGMTEPDETMWHAADVVCSELIEQGVIVPVEGDVPTYVPADRVWKYRAIGILFDLPLPNGQVARNVVDEGILSLCSPIWRFWSGKEVNV